jgi:hypothetical protein
MMPSLATIKAQLADLPGIDALSMQILVGRHNYQIGGKLISVDPGASVDKIATEIRAALSAQVPTPVTINSASLLPSVGLEIKRRENKSMAITGAGGAALTLKALIEKRKAKIQADLEGHFKEIESEFDAQDKVVAGVGQLPGKIKTETSDLAASIGQFANDILGETE